MVVVGLVYLVFERTLLTRSAGKHDSAAPADNTLSRVLLGIQVCSMRPLSGTDVANGSGSWD